MCGIAGLIHRDGATSVGKEMTAMLMSLKHRGPDSTGFAIYGPSTANEYVMRLKLAEQEDMTKDHHIRQKIRERQAEVDRMLAEIGAETVEVAEATPYAFRYRLRYAGDTRRLAADIEQIEGAEVLSFGSALELIKDLGDATQVSEQYGLGSFRGTHGIGHTRMATESDVDIRSAHPYWAYPYNDIAVVHNGQITNYWIMRREMERLGHRFMSNCDSELLAVYTANNLEQGATLEDSLKASIKDIDGVFHPPSRISTAFTYVATETSSAWPRTPWRRSRWCCSRAIIWWRSPPRRSPSAPSCRARSTRRTLTTKRFAYGRANARRADRAGALSHEMGLHTEKLGGRTQQAFFDIDLNEAHHGFSLPNAYDVDYNKRAEIDASNMPSNAVNLRIRELMQDGYGTIVIKNPGAKHSIARRHSQSAQPHHRRLARLFRARPDRRPECAHLRPRRLVLRREHDERHDPDREERRLAIRRGDPRRRPRLQGRCRLAHRHRHEGRHDHRRRRYRRVHRLHDAARAHGDLRQCRQESRRLHV